MEIEKLATSAVQFELAKTDRLSSFINSGDKEPCWDGNIYIHENKLKTKQNIKKVAIQVKGKLVKSKRINRTVSYSISYDDLNAYMMNGGTMFFLVYIDENTTEPLQIYYTNLLPIKIEKILKNKKKKYSIKFRKFPKENLKKTELFINFYNDAKRQASFAGQVIPTIEELSKKGVLESLSFHYTSLGNNNTYISFPKLLDEQSMTIYANVKGAAAPIPVEYHEVIKDVMMSTTNDLPITVNEVMYYPNYLVIATAEETKLKIGSSVIITIPNIEEDKLSLSFNLKVKVKGSLQEQIKAMEFILAFSKYGSFNIGDIVIPSNFPQKELDKIGINEFTTRLELYKKIQKVLNSMNVKKDLDISECSDEDLKKLNLIIETIGNKKLVRKKPDMKVPVDIVKISNITLAIVYVENLNGGYNVFDYFGQRFYVTWKDNGKVRRISQFSTMIAEDFIELDNLNLNMIVEDYKMIEPSEYIFGLANLTMLEMLKAYDKKPSKELLTAAEKMINWMIDSPDYLSSDITTINRLQIVLRKRRLTFQEEKELYLIIDKTNDDLIKIGALLLLNRQEVVDEIMKSLDEEDLNKLKDFPIYRFYKEIKLGE